MYNGIWELYSEEDTIMAQNCSRCGSKMKKRDWPGEWECPKCGMVHIDHSEDDYAYENVFFERPEYCNACDSDTYPACMDGCPLVEG